MDSKEQIAKRLKQARNAAGFSSARAAAESLGVPYPTYAAHENGSRGVERDAAQHYSRRYKVSLDWLLTGQGHDHLPDTKQRPLGIRRVDVAAHIQAGAWSESWEWPYEDHYSIYIPDDIEFRDKVLLGAETLGPSMNKRYPERTVIVFNDIQQVREPPIPGKRYVVERRRASGEAEHTVKLLHRDEDGKFWLLPESNDPRYQSAISLEDGNGEDDVITLLGRVCYAVARE